MTDLELSVAFKEEEDTAVLHSSEKYTVEKKEELKAKWGDVYYGNVNQYYGSRW